VAPDITQVGYGAQYSGGIAVNRDWYEAQSQVLQDALVAGAKVFGENYLADLRQATDSAMKALVAGGGTLNPQSDALRAAYAEAIEDPTTGWVATLEKQGLPAGEALKAYMQAVRDAGAKPERDWGRD